eukprot:1466888-Rhodomonas_salina.2
MELPHRTRTTPHRIKDTLCTHLAGVEAVSVGVRVVVREEREDLRGVVLPLHPAHNRHVLDRVPGLVCTLPHRRHLPPPTFLFTPRSSSTQRQRPVLLSRR